MKTVITRKHIESIKKAMEALAEIEGIQLDTQPRFAFWRTHAHNACYMVIEKAMRAIEEKDNAIEF